MIMEDLGSSSQWLVERARQSLRENNPYEAKAWLITAKTLYPKDFGVQVSSELACNYLFINFGSFGISCLVFIPFFVSFVLRRLHPTYTEGTIDLVGLSCTKEFSI